MFQFSCIGGIISSNISMCSFKIFPISPLVFAHIIIHFSQTNVIWQKDVEWLMPLRAQLELSSTSEHHGYVCTALRVLKMRCQLLALLVSCLKIFVRYLWWYDSILSTSEPVPAPGLTSCLALFCPHHQGGAQCPGLGLLPAAPWLPWIYLGMWNGS